MRVFTSYRELINHPTVVIGVGVIGVCGLLLHNTYMVQQTELSVLNFVEAFLLGSVLISYIFIRYKEQKALGLYAIIFWLDLLVSPFLVLHSPNFTPLFLRNAMFYWALLPLIGLLLGNRAFQLATLIFFLQHTAVTFITDEPFLVSSYFSIAIILAIYLIIIYSFISSLQHFVQTQEEIQAQLEQQSAELNESNGAKSKLLSIIGHDLRSPLMSLSSLSVLISEEVNDQDNQDLKDYSEILSLTIDQTTLLVNNLLEWSRSHDNRITIEHKVIALEPFAKSLEDLVHFQLLNKQITFKIGPFETPMVLADQNTLFTILRNLVTNAIKFTPHKGTIQISSTIEEHGFQLIVKDSGVGMTQEAIDKLLDPASFNTTKGTNMEKGSGIGFNLVLEMMRLHNGHVSIDSEPGKGTAIKLFFPEKADPDEN